MEAMGFRSDAIALAEPAIFDGNRGQRNAHVLGLSDESRERCAFCDACTAERKPVASPEKEHTFSDRVRYAFLYQRAMEAQRTTEGS